MTPDEFETLTGIPLTDTAYDCHGAAHALVRALGAGRVARGACVGVPGQHSWAVLGDDCYDWKTRLLDPTLWCYEGVEPYVWSGTLSDELHRPHGAGDIWHHGRPSDPEGEVITLDVDPGQEGRDFLEFAAPHGLDYRGWHVLLHSPVGGWPARQIIEAAYATPRLRVIIPIDIVGMVTDINPGGAYL